MLSADGQTYSYKQVLELVIHAVSWLYADKAAPKYVAIFGSRSVEACVGVLAAAWVGAAYVPINLKLPALAVADLLRRSGVDALICDRGGSSNLNNQILEHGPKKVLAVRGFVPKDAHPQVVWFEDLPPNPHISPPITAAADAIACILHTSGSTGRPKGVMVPSSAVKHFLDEMETSYPLCRDDRVAETTELSFDLSVYNMFSTWRAGACLHIIPKSQAPAPTKFIIDHSITVWLSVPSIAALMHRMGMLKPGSMRSLRYSFFRGRTASSEFGGSVASRCSIVGRRQFLRSDGGDSGLFGSRIQVARFLRARLRRYRTAVRRNDSCGRTHSRNFSLRDTGRTMALRAATGSRLLERTRGDSSSFCECQRNTLVSNRRPRVS